MSARSSPFRSHLLQQWTSSRRSPIVVQPWLRKEEEEEKELHQNGNNNDESEDFFSPDDTIHRSRLNGPQRHHSPQTRLNSNHHPSSSIGASTFSRSYLSSLSLPSAEHSAAWGKNILEESYDDYVDDKNKQDGNAFLLQDMLLKQNKSKKLPLSSSSIKSFLLSTDDDILSQHNDATLMEKKLHHHHLQRQQQQFLDSAIDRGVKDAQQKAIHNLKHQYKSGSHNHRNRLPYSFRRFFSDSRSSKRLNEIRRHQNVSISSSACVVQDNDNDEIWNSAEAYLVALVCNNRMKINPSSSSSLSSDKLTGKYSLYEPMDYSPPIDEHQLEDYGLTFAAVQNVTISLHNDGYNCTWMKDEPIIHTPAFRNLVKADDTDRIVALLLVQKDEQLKHPRRRLRKESHQSVTSDSDSDSAGGNRRLLSSSSSKKDLLIDLS